MMADCANPSHGRYVSGCRCDACRAANSAYERGRRKRKAYGRLLTVDAEPVRRHVRRLMGMGLSEREIARLAGVARSSMRHLTNGHHRTGEPVRTMSRANAERLLAVDGSSRKLGSRQTVKSRMLSDIPRLKASGLSIRAMARATGIGACTLYRIHEGRGSLVTAATHAKWMRALPAMERAAGSESGGRVAFIKRDW